MLKGIDIYHQDDVNVALLPADIAFVFLKATQGISGQDSAFQDRYHTLKNSRPEIVRLPYHYFDWTADGVEQAKNILSRGVNYNEPGTGPMALDLEGDGDVADYVTNNTEICIQRVNDFINYVRANCGRQEFIIYSFDYFVKNNLKGHTWPDCMFWISSVQDTPPTHPAWPVTFWQYQTVPSDLDYYLGTQDQLNKLANII